MLSSERVKRVFSVAALLLTVFLVTAFTRYCLYSVLIVPDTGHEPSLLQGDRLLVSRWAYGWRRTFGTYHRYRVRFPRHGDWVAFNTPNVEVGALPDTSSLCIGKILAMPGDTIWMGRGGKVSLHRDYLKGCIWPLIVPARGSFVRFNSWDSELYARTIERHEQDSTKFAGDQLYINGKVSDFYRFHRDYFWIQSGNDSNVNDSRSFGFVPFEFLLGQVQTVLYSFDPQLPLIYRFRRDRFCRSLP